MYNLKPKPDTNFTKTKIFINEIICILSDLKPYGYDCLNSKEACILLSHFVFHKLPAAFQQELVRKLRNNYPDIEDIFEHYTEVVRTLNLQATKPVKNDKAKTYGNSYSVSKFATRVSEAILVQLSKKFMPISCKMLSTVCQLKCYINPYLRIFAYEIDVCLSSNRSFSN